MPNERIERISEPLSMPENPVTTDFERAEPHFSIALRYIQEGKRVRRKRNIYKVCGLLVHPVQKYGIVRNHV